MKTFRRTPTAAALVALAAGLTGCFPFIQADNAKQADVMAGVSVATKACTSTLLSMVERSQQGGVDSFDDFCAAREDAVDFYYSDLSEASIPMPGQILLSYRVPKGTDAPATLTATNDVVHMRDWWEWLMGEGSPRGGTGTGTNDERPEPPGTREVEVTFTRSTDLDEKVPAYYARTDEGVPGNAGRDIVGDDQQIVSYISDVVPGASVGEWEVEAPFGLPSGARPFSGPFNHVTMVGWRAAMTPELEPPVRERNALRSAGVLRGSVFEDMFGDLDPNRPVNCEFTAILPELVTARRSLRGVAEEEPEEDFTICPLPKLDIVQGDDEEGAEPTGADYAKAFAGTDTATRDLDVRGGGETFAEQGSTAKVPFKLVGAGPAGGKLDLVATVSPAINGVGDITSEIDFPGTGTTARDVELKLPADAPARTYEVTLTAASKSGAKRTAKAGLVVLPKAAAATAQQQAAEARSAESPKAKSSRRGNVYMDAQGNLRFGSLCGTCSIDALVPFGSVGDKARAAQSGSHRLLRVARGKVKGKAGVRTKARVKLFPKAQRSLRRGRRLNGVLVFRTGKSGVPQVRKVVFRTRAKK